MTIFGFGRRSRPKKPAFRIHVQGPWRIVRDDTILVGQADWLWPPLDSDIHYRDFNESEAGRTRRDDLLEAMLTHGEDAHVVESAAGADSGDLRIVLGDGFVLEVFPHSAATGDGDEDEHWRLLRSGPRKRHFVVTAHGIEQ